MSDTEKGRAEGPNDLLTRDEVADMLQVSVGTVQNLYLGGRMESFRIGRHVRIRRQAVWDYLEGRKYTPPPPLAAQDWTTDPPTPSMLENLEDKS